MPSEFKEKSVKFANSVSAHGLGKIASAKTILSAILWLLITIGCVCGFIIATVTRINSFKKSNSKVSYTTNTEYPKTGLELPSVSICQEGFNSEFMVNDLLLSYYDEVRDLIENQQEFMVRKLYDKEFMAQVLVGKDENQLIFLRDLIYDDMIVRIKDEWLNMTNGYQYPLNITGVGRPSTLCRNTKLN